MRSTILATFIAVAAAFAQPGLAPPQIGFIQDAANSLRPVYGIAGNFVLGDALAADVCSAAFSGSFGLLKTDSALIAVDKQGQAMGSIDAAEGPALFAFARDGAPALAYLPGTNRLMHWNGTGFDAVCTMPGESVVVAIASPGSGHAALIVARDDGLWDLRIQLGTGEVSSQSALSGITAPIMMLASGELIYGSASGLVVRTPGGSETQVAASLPDRFSLQQMGEGWIQIRDLDSIRQFAVRVTIRREGFYALPGVEQ